jgi:acyl dehydratase
MVAIALDLSMRRMKLTRGLYYEELEEDVIYEHTPGRTITATDNNLFTLMAVCIQPLHINQDFAEGTIHGERVVSSMLTMAVCVGMQVHDLTLGTTLGNLSYEEVKFPNPVLVGDTLYSETEILDKRLSESRDDSGVVRFEHRGYNQNEELVFECERVGLMMLKPEETEDGYKPVLLNEDGNTDS